MAYDQALADKIRQYLITVPKTTVEEKEMFSGLCFMVNGKMCVNVSENNLMCRFDPALYDELVERHGFENMVMRGKILKGYCYVSPEGFRSKKDFDYWMNLCLDYNAKAQLSKRRKKPAQK